MGVEAVCYVVIEGSGQSSTPPPYDKKNDVSCLLYIYPWQSPSGWDAVQEEDVCFGSLYCPTRSRLTKLNEIDKKKMWAVCYSLDDKAQWDRQEEDVSCLL